MAFSIRTHDSWGAVPVGDFQSQDEALRAFSNLCQDPWYTQDGTVKGLELVEITPGGDLRQIDWFAFR